MMRRKFSRRSAKPNVQWSDVSGQFLIAAVSATTTAVLVQLQSPANLSALTADPPEDLTLLRMVGDYYVNFTGAGASNWTLALLVADVTWTPGATFATDADKRILWHRTFQTSASTTVKVEWGPPGWHEKDAGQTFPDQGVTHLDITPRVKVEAGKALYLVVYENLAVAGTLTVSSTDMRVLYRRSGRR